MPKKPIDYSKTVIYKIQHVSENYVYVGCTTDFTKRKAQHKAQSHISNDGLYKFMRDNGGWNKFIMSPIKELNCKNSIEAHIEEEKMRVECNANINRICCDGANKVECLIQRKEREIMKKQHELKILYETLNTLTCEDCETTDIKGNEKYH